MTMRRWNNRHGIREVDHFSLPCADVERSLSFYEEILGAVVYEDDLGEYRHGFNERDRALGRAKHLFLLIGQTRVELLGARPETLTAVRAAADAGQTPPLGTHHAFSIGPNDLQPFLEHLQAHGVPYWGPASHAGAHAVSIYFKDPDRNQLEVTCWDNYPRPDEATLSQHMAKPSDDYDWDPVARRAYPKVTATA